MAADLHHFLDWDYESDDALRALLAAGADPNARKGPLAETSLHVAARRRRAHVIPILLAHGAELDARNAGGKTAWAHAVRRGFADVAAVLTGAATDLTEADRLAIAMVEDRLADARAILAAHPEIARTGNREEDRLLADLAGRPGDERVRMLIEAGADLAATGLDDGTPLHEAAWFGEPTNAKILVAAGAPLDVYDATHGSSPLGWAVHGSRYSGDADVRQDRYVEIVRVLLAAGATIKDAAFLARLRGDATPAVLALLPDRV
jgi:ankyrin repeat protein